MKYGKIILLCLALLLLSGIVPIEQQDSSYTSPWVELFDGESVTFTHSIEPVKVAYVWVAEPVGLDDFSAKRPWLEYPGINIMVFVDKVTVYNYSGETVIIQAVVE